MQKSRGRSFLDDEAGCDDEEGYSEGEDLDEYDLDDSFIDDADAMETGSCSEASRSTLPVDNAIGTRAGNF